ncbi:MAG: AEC family transporter [Ilumatobacter sp.]|nr:AEC family transporter [Ilumatobacter sp.]
MSVANVLFDVLAPVALVVVLGAVVGRRLDFDVASLSRLSFYVLGPAFVFAVLADAELDGSVVVRLVLAGLAGMAASLVVVAVWARIGDVDFEIAAATAMTSAYGNVGNAGLAIVGFALGDDALPIAGVLMLTINIGGLVLSVGLAEARSRSPFHAVVRAVSAPMAVAGALAVVVNAGNVDLPLVIDRPIGLLAGALIPIMLFTLGLQLVQTGATRPTGDVGLMLACKLALAPLAAGAVAAALGLDGDFLDAVIIQSAMPPAVFCAVVAIEYDLAPDRVTTGVVVGTIASVLTLPVVLIAL